MEIIYFGAISSSDGKEHSSDGRECGTVDELPPVFKQGEMGITSFQF